MAVDLVAVAGVGEVVRVKRRAVRVSSFQGKARKQLKDRECSESQSKPRRVNSVPPTFLCLRTKQKSSSTPVAFVGFFSLDLLSSEPICMFFFRSYLLICLPREDLEAFG